MEQTVCFIGLPSAGKSTIVNSLVGKRILQSGVCRTTTEIHLIGTENIFNFPPDRFHQNLVKSDDGITMNILDLPGMADAENKGKETNFDEMTKAWVTNSNIIFWVTDINTAFLTTYEKKEFDQINSLLKKNTSETGTLYQFAIILAKYEHEPNEVSQIPQNTTYDGEITDTVEDTTIEDCHKRVVTLFKDQDIKIIKFNAFGRILSNPKISKPLLQLVKQFKTGGHPVNTEFKLQWAVEDIEKKQQYSYLTCLLNYHFKGLTTVNCPYGNVVLQNCAYTEYATCGCNNYSCSCVSQTMFRCNQCGRSDLTCPSCPTHGRCCSTNSTGNKNRCSFHGNCQYGKNKILDGECFNKECKYHNKEKCLFGNKLEENCGNTYCPQHTRIKFEKIRELVNKITNQCLLTMFLQFVVLDNETDFAKFYEENKLFSKITYDDKHLNLLSYVVGRRKSFETLVDTVPEIVKNTNPNVLYRLINLIGKDHICTVKIWLNNVGKSISCPPMSYHKPRDLTTWNDDTYPSMFKIDYECKTNQKLCCSKKWIAKVRERRNILWGNEDDLDLQMFILHYVISGAFSGKNINSVLDMV